MQEEEEEGEGKVVVVHETLNECPICATSLFLFDGPVRNLICQMYLCF
jgi:hypothetical protein